MVSSRPFACRWGNRGPKPGVESLKVSQTQYRARTASSWPGPLSALGHVYLQGLLWCFGLSRKVSHATEASKEKSPLQPLLRSAHNKLIHPEASGRGVLWGSWLGRGLFFGGLPRALCSSCSLISVPVSSLGPLPSVAPPFREREFQYSYF